MTTEPVEAAAAPPAQAALLRGAASLNDVMARYSRWAIPFAVIALAALFALQLLRGTVLYERWVQDVFIHMNAVRHMEAGGLPHMAFSTPVGAFYYVAHYVAAQLGPLSAFTAVYANALVGGLAAALAIAAGYRRLKPGWTAVLALYVGVVAMSPRHLGELFISFNASYNRWGWAMLAVLTIVVSVPRADGTRRAAALLDGVLTAGLIALLFFTKATYAAVGVGMVLAALVTVRRKALPVLFGAVTAAGIALLIAVVELSFGIVAAYLGELRTAAAAQSSSRIEQLIRITYFTSADIVAILAIGACAAASGGTVGEWRKWLFLLVLIAAGLGVAMQNNPALEVPLVPVAGLAILHVFGRGTQPAAGWPRLARFIAGAAVLLLFLRPLILDSKTLLEESFGAPAPGADVDWLQETILKDLAFRAAPNRILESGHCAVLTADWVEDREYLAAVNDGLRLLEAQKARGSTVLSLSWINPFPILIDGPPVRHELSWWDPGRSFDAARHPPAEKLFRDVDYVMIPKFSYFPQTTAVMLQVYGDRIGRDFRVLSESSCWRLMGRKTPAGAPAPAVAAPSTSG